MTSKNIPKTSRLANPGVLLTGRKRIPPPSFVDKTRRHPAITIGLHADANRRFGTGENDWLGAEAYIDPLR